LKLKFFKHPFAMLVLLMSRPLIIMSASLVKLTCSSCIPQQASAKTKNVHWQALARVLQGSS
jgi:hypothetical protein